MTMRLNYGVVAPEAIKAMMGLEKTVAEMGLEPKLFHLVKLRASQINGCAYCINMHNHEARADGESQQRLDLLSAWRETNFFDERERAALAWTDRPAISFQFHPEFEPDYAKALIKQRYDVLPNPDAALASLDQPDDRARVTEWIRRFLTSDKTGEQA